MAPKNVVVKANKAVNKTPVKSILKDTKSPMKKNNKSVKINSKVQVSQGKKNKKVKEESEEDDDEVEDDVDEMEEEDMLEEEDNDMVEDQEEEEEEDDGDEEEEEEEEVIPVKNNKRKQEVATTPSKKTKVENKSAGGSYRAFIRNLGRGTNEDDLYQFFRENDVTPLDVSVPRRSDGFCKGFGFAGFQNQSDLDKALKLNESSFNGSTIAITVSNDPKGVTKSSTLIVKNLAASVDEDTLASHFPGAVSARVITGQGVSVGSGGQSKGYGFVDFSSEEDAEKALNKLQGSMLGNQNIYLSFAQPKNNNNAPRKNFQNNNNNDNDSRGNHRGGNRGGSNRGGERGGFRGGNNRRGGFNRNNNRGGRQRQD